MSLVDFVRLSSRYISSSRTSERSEVSVYENSIILIPSFFCMKKIPELHEKSAGGIVYRRRADELEILMLAWKNAREEIEYVLPK